METETPNKPQNTKIIISSNAASNNNQNFSINRKYQSPIEIEDYTASKFFVKKGNLSSIKTAKNAYDNSKNGLQPYFKFRSKSCEKNQKEDRFLLIIIRKSKELN